MPFKTLNFPTTELMTAALNGSVVGGKEIVLSGGKVRGLHLLTLIIAAEVVTFADASDAGLPLVGVVSVKAQIEAATTGVTVSYDRGRIVLSKATGILVKATGTTNLLFGFPNNVDVAGTVYDVPGGAVPRIIAIGSSPRMDSYFVTVEVA